MDDPDDRAYAREPQIEDLVRICHALNAAGARYVLFGGFAVIAHGGTRTTKGIDLLVDASSSNIAKVKSALGILADNAAAELSNDEVEKYAVVRVADEVVVDLMARACSVDYDQAAADVEEMIIQGVSLPVAGPHTLIRTKDTLRPSDAADRRYLEWLIEARRSEGGQ